MLIDTIILDVAHAGKPSKPQDRGCHHDGIYESDVALQYVLFIRERFFVSDYKVFLITSGEYTERRLWANKNCPAATSLYLSCHLNAGNGRYSLVEYHHDARDQTKRLAEYIATEFHQILNTEYPDMSYAPGGVRGIERFGRGSICLRNTRMSALLIEPFFLDNPEHLKLHYKKLASIASAVYNGVEEFNRSEPY